MAAPTKKTGWGSFLSQAVGGLEARLDNILAEDEASSARDAKPSPGSAAQPSPASPSKQTASPGKSQVSLSGLLILTVSRNRTIENILQRPNQ